MFFGEQRPYFGVAAVMPEDTGICVLGVENGVNHELTDRIVLHPVDHLSALTTSSHEARHP